MDSLSWILPPLSWLLAPLLPGIINRVKAIVAGRRGQPLLQSYYDLAKLMRKGAVLSRTTSGIFRMAPALVLVSLLAGSALVPWGGWRAPISFSGDFILLAYLFGLARFTMVLAALDTGSSFMGMGASREVQFSALVEPTLLLGLLLLVFLTGRSSLSDIAAAFGPASWRSAPAVLFLLACAWIVLLLAENARIPVDDPNTHLELTMIHEVMLLDTGGPDLGTMLAASFLKLWLFSSLLTNLILPLRPAQGWLQPVVFILGNMGVAVIVGLIESATARLRLVRVPKLLIGSGVLAATALILQLVGLS